MESQLFGFLNGLLDKMEDQCQMEKLWDITRAMVENKSELLGQLTLGFVKKKHGELMEQEHYDCPRCKKEAQKARKTQKRN